VSRFSPDRYRLQLAERTLVLSTRRTREREWQQLATGEHPGVAHEPEFSAALKQFCQLRLPRGARWSVLIDDELARFFVLSAPERIASLRELQLVSALRCESLFGDPAGDWVCMGDWRARGAFLVCALPKSLMRALTAVTSLQRSRLDSVTPRFVHTWNECASRMHQQHAWVAHVTARHAVLVAASGGRPMAVLQFTAPGWEDLDALRTLVRRASLQWGLPTPTTLYMAGEPMRIWHGHTVDGCNIQHLELAPEPQRRRTVLKTPCPSTEETHA